MKNVQRGGARWGEELGLGGTEGVGGRTGREARVRRGERDGWGFIQTCLTASPSFAATYLQNMHRERELDLDNSIFPRTVV